MGGLPAVWEWSWDDFFGPSPGLTRTRLKTMEAGTCERTFSDKALRAGAKSLMWVHHGGEFGIRKWVEERLIDTRDDHAGE